MKNWMILGLGALVYAIVWSVSREVPQPARFVMALFAGPLPAASIVQARMIGNLQDHELPGRMGLYGGTLLGLWGICLAAAIAASESGFSPKLLGVTPLPWPTFLVWLFFSLTATGAILIGYKALGGKESPLLRHLIPQTRNEKIVFAGVSLSAGICEELAFRGFLIAGLHVATGSLPLAVVIAAAVFGAAHAHQHVSGAARAALLGLVLSVPLLLTGSLYPAVAAHAIIDLAGGLWLSKWLLK